MSTDTSTSPVRRGGNFIAGGAGLTFVGIVFALIAANTVAAGHTVGNASPGGVLLILIGVTLLVIGLFRHTMPRK